jgi:enoyl-CoA hydratase/carnithine racemase
LIAGSGGLLRLPRRIPPQIAMELALTGDLLPATEARQWGLVNRLVPAGQALEVALALAERIAANGPMAVRVAKQVVSELFTAYLADPQAMPDSHAQRDNLPRAVADYIAGMTDRFASREHARLTGKTAPV